MPNNAFNNSSYELYSYINQEIDNESIIGFYKPRLLRLATGKKTVYPDFGSIRYIDFLIIDPSLKNTFDEELLLNFELVLEVNEYLIFKKLF